MVLFLILYILLPNKIHLIIKLVILFENTYPHIIIDVLHLSIMMNFMNDLIFVKEFRGEMVVGVIVILIND